MYKLSEDKARSQQMSSLNTVSRKLQTARSLNLSEYSAVVFFNSWCPTAWSSHSAAHKKSISAETLYTRVRLYPLAPSSSPPFVFFPPFTIPLSPSFFHLPLLLLLGGVRAIFFDPRKYSLRPERARGWEFARHISRQARAFLARSRCYWQDIHIGERLYIGAHSRSCCSSLSLSLSFMLFSVHYSPEAKLIPNPRGITCMYICM